MEGGPRFVQMPEGGPIFSEAEIINLSKVVPCVALHFIYGSIFINTGVCKYMMWLDLRTLT